MLKRQYPKNKDLQCMKSVTIDALIAVVSWIIRICKQTMQNHYIDMRQRTQLGKLTSLMKQKTLCHLVGNATFISQHLVWRISDNGCRCP